MKLKKIFAALAATVVSISSFAVFASAEARTDDEYLELLNDVASVKATVEIKTLEPTTAGGFAAFYMQNQGGSWDWFASADEAATTKLTGAGTYEVAWTDVQKVIKKDDGTSKLAKPAAEWEKYPMFGIQIGSDGITEVGATGKVEATVTNVVITFTDESTMTIDKIDVAGDLLGEQQDWGLSGNNVMFDMVDLIKAGTIVEKEPVKDPGNGDTTPPADNNDENKPTGLVGLSVAGLAVAGAAVVATKKRK